MDLLPSGSDMRMFYIDQKNQRWFRVNAGADVEYKEEQCEDMEVQNQLDEELRDEMSFVFQDDSIDEVEVKYTRESCANCISTPTAKFDTKSVQVNLNPLPEFRKQRNVDDAMKDTIAKVSTKAAISIQKARIATQTVCETLYGHSFKLEPECETSNTSANHAEPPESKRPRSAKDYEKYKEVLPSSKTCSSFKHKKSLAQEIEAAKRIMNKASDVRLTLHHV